MNSITEQERDLIKERFDEKIEGKNEHGCILWQGMMSNGYGYFYWDGDLYPAHRIAYLLHFLEIPKRKQVCHKCVNKTCVNIEHLWVGNAQQTHKSRDFFGHPVKSKIDKEAIFWNLVTNTHPESTPVAVITNKFKQEQDRVRTGIINVLRRNKHLTHVKYGTVSSYTYRQFLTSDLYVNCQNFLRLQDILEDLERREKNGTQATNIATSTSGH